MSESREIPGTPVSAASAAKRSAEEIELLVVPLNGDPLAYSMGPVTAGTLHLMLGEALAVPTFVRSQVGDAILSDATNGRIQDALYRPELFAHREVGEKAEHFRAKAVANALHYDDEQLRGMGLARPVQATEEFEHEDVIRALNPGIGEITRGPTIVSPGPPPPEARPSVESKMWRWRGPWEPGMTVQSFDAVLDEGEVYVYEGETTASVEPPAEEEGWTKVPRREPFRTPALDRYGEQFKMPPGVTVHNRLPRFTLAAAAVLVVLLALAYLLMEVWT